jgi:phosphatidylglycerophosphate synthase
MSEGIKKAERIQTSILNGLEKKCLAWLAERQPRWVVSDTLTFVGIAGALMTGLGYMLSDKCYCWLWLAVAGFIVNWYGDSLDGSLARVRNTQRPIYGFFIDHIIDGITIAIMCYGAGLSWLVNMYVSLSVLVVYLLLSIYVYIGAHLKNEFKLTYAHMGPTEFRAIVFIINIFFMYIPSLREYSRECCILGRTLNLSVYDFLLVVIFIVLTVLYICSIVGDAKRYAIEDPLPKMKD